MMLERRIICTLEKKTESRYEGQVGNRREIGESEGGFDMSRVVVVVSRDGMVVDRDGMSLYSIVDM